MTDIQFQACIDRIKKGDPGGLKQIYEEYLPMIFRTVEQMLGQREDAEDLTADFFVHLYSVAGSYRGGNGHKGWLLTIARNMARNLLRSRGREILTGDYENLGENSESEMRSGASKNEGPTLQSGGGTESPVEEAVTGSIFLEQALEELTPAEREVTYLRVVEDMSFREISEALEKPLGTVTATYYSAIKRLRRFGYEE